MNSLVIFFSFFGFISFSLFMFYLVVKLLKFVFSKKLEKESVSVFNSMQDLLNLLNQQQDKEQ